MFGVHWDHVLSLTFSGEMEKMVLNIVELQLQLTPAAGILNIFILQL